MVVCRLFSCYIIHDTLTSNSQFWWEAAVWRREKSFCLPQCPLSACLLSFITCTEDKALIVGLLNNFRYFLLIFIFNFWVFFLDNLYSNMKRKYIFVAGLSEISPSLLYVHEVSFTKWVAKIKWTSLLGRTVIGLFRISRVKQFGSRTTIINKVVVTCPHGTYIGWPLRNRCARKVQSLLFNRFKAFD